MDKQFYEITKILSISCENLHVHSFQVYIMCAESDYFRLLMVVKFLVKKVQKC